MKHPAYLEDFTVGERHDVGTFTMDKDEIVDFARQFDPQPFHIDEDAAKASPFGGLIASGWHTCAKLMRTMCDAYLLKAGGAGSPGIENISWIKPVRPGDTISILRETEKVNPSRSKPDRGMVLSKYTLTNQHGEVVMTMQGWGMFFRRDASPSTPEHAA